MTQGDVRFLHKLFCAHREVIREDCNARKLGSKVYFSRIGRAERIVKNILNGELN